MAYFGFVSSVAGVPGRAAGENPRGAGTGSFIGLRFHGSVALLGGRLMRLLKDNVIRRHLPLETMAPGSARVQEDDLRGLELPRLVREATSPSGRSERVFKFAALTLMAVLTAGVISRTGFWTGRFSIPTSDFGNATWLATFLYGGLMYAILFWRLALWLRYRPMATVQDARLPSVTVVMPVFNEGALVAEAIRSVAASRYPAGRLEIVVVDDGSTDDSWLHILRAAREVKQRVRVTTLRHLTNLGKRAALHFGFENGSGDVFVTVDSDSILHPEALRSGVSALVRDPRVGCVAGCVEVLNPRESAITRFLKGSFSLSFKFVRAYQNEFRGVFCTPGALSFYRADYVRSVADEWLDQRFLGQPCTTGEDRAMTNLFLRDGWLTAYQENAKVYSKMPATFAGMCRMFLRWARSNIRETVFLFSFLFRRFRGAYLNTFRFNMVLATMSLILPPLLIAGNIGALFASDGYVFHQYLAVMTYALSVAVIYYVNERDSDWVWLMIYEFVWVASLWWIIPYAFATLRNTGWLTRKVEAEPVGRVLRAQPVAC